VREDTPERPTDSFAFAEVLDAEIQPPEIHTKLAAFLDSGMVGGHHFEFFSDATDPESDNPVLATIDGFKARWDGTHWVAD
jgi:hypothetical protein